MSALALKRVIRGVSRPNTHLEHGLLEGHLPGSERVVRGACGLVCGERGTGRETMQDGGQTTREQGVVGGGGRVGTEAVNTAALPPFGRALDTLLFAVVTTVH